MENGINTIISEIVTKVATVVNEALKTLPPAVVSLIVKDALNQLERCNTQAIIAESQTATSENTEKVVTENETRNNPDASV